MNYGEYRYVWQAPGWPVWRVDLARLAQSLAETSAAQGHLLGRLADVGLQLRGQASLAALTDDVLKTSEIEGEELDPFSVRSSVARRLGMDIGALAPADRAVDGVVDMVLDATGNAQEPVTRERLWRWHVALFPGSESRLVPLRVGAWRDDATGPMQVVSGPITRPRVHFEAPPAAILDAEMARFLDWVNAPQPLHPLLKAGIGHLWFVTLHPFDDGNGRIARALGDLLLARAEESTQRFYSLSAQIQRERKAYYEILEQTQRGNLDATEWLDWFLGTLLRAINHSQQILNTVLAKSNFWQRRGTLSLNERQVKLLNRLLDGFDGKLTSSKWAAIAKCSPDTALRDINELVAQGVLSKSDAGGRSTSYVLGDD